jgi:hypothetical protein
MICSRTDPVRALASSASVVRRENLRYVPTFGRTVMATPFSPLNVIRIVAPERAARRGLGVRFRN